MSLSGAVPRNLSYLGGGEGEDCNLRPAQASESSQDPISTNKAGCGGAHLSFQLPRKCK
jgi:hypothetical protein